MGDIDIIELSDGNSGDMSFGGGIELLMNDRVRDSVRTRDYDINIEAIVGLVGGPDMSFLDAGLGPSPGGGRGRRGADRRGDL